VIAELKCLQKNSILDLGFVSRLGRAYAKLMREGRAPVIRDQRTVSLQQIEQYGGEGAVERFMEPYLTRLDRIVRKGNSQIAASAKHFGILDPRGLLILANEGELAFELGLIAPFLTILLPRYHAINTVLYFTESVTVNVPGYHPAADVWMPMTMYDRAAADNALLIRLRDCWINRVATLRGMPVMAKIVGEKDQIDVSQILFTNGKRLKLKIE
jgi:hypothetical protein